MLINDSDYIRMQGELGELRRFAQEAVDERKRALKKGGRLGPAVRQLDTYLGILRERERPALERIEQLAREAARKHNG